MLREGEVGDEFFLVAQGQIAVERRGRQVGTLGPGGYFGELALFDEAECIHLTTLYEGALGMDGDSVGERMGAVNDHLEALADEHDDIDLIDWNAALREREADGDADLLVDTVHPTAAGQRLLRDLSVDALDSCS